MNFINTLKTALVNIEISGVFVLNSVCDIENVSEENDGIIVYCNNGTELFIPKDLKEKIQPGDISEECHIYYNDIYKIYIESLV